METNTEVATKPAAPLTTASLFNRDDVKKKFQEMLGKKAQGFITSVLQITASNDKLKNADPMSVYNSAAMAATLDLPLNNNLGFAYIVPYNEKYQDGEGQWKQRQVAQFQMGYKGFIQLAMRTGKYRTISAAPIYEGQIIEENPLTGYVFDFSKKKSETIIGFASYFSLINGFEKTWYMSMAQMKAHGGKYSKTFNNQNGRWTLDFESMALKTVLKMLLSKYGMLSIEMQTAVKIDQAILKDDTGDDVIYADHEVVESNPVDKEAERMQLLIADCKTIAEVEQLQLQAPDYDVEKFEARKAELKGGKGGK